MDELITNKFQQYPEAGPGYCGGFLNQNLIALLRMWSPILHIGEGFLLRAPVCCIIANMENVEGSFFGQFGKCRPVVTG